MDRCRVCADRRRGPVSRAGAFEGVACYGNGIVDARMTSTESKLSRASPNWPIKGT
jgi:hypothetical protein